MIRVKRINNSSQDINIPNEPFSLWGKMIVSYNGEKWTYLTDEFHENDVTEMIFPDENYDFEALKKDYFFIGAYDDQDKCIGLAIYKKDWFKYLYLEDLKVVKSYRGQGIGKLLLDEGKQLAKENDYRGIYTIGQDNNLSACLFYLKSGFFIRA